MASRPSQAPWLAAVVRGSSFLVARHAAVSAVNFGSTLALAWFLTPGDWGAFAVADPFVIACTLIMDLGLTAALVRVPAARLEGLAARIVRLQVLLGAAAAALLWAVAARWQGWYGLAPGQEWILRLDALALLLLPLRQVAVARLERDLAFPRIAALETAEALGAQAVVVTLAWRGAGPFALVAGPLLRAVVGAVVAPVLAGWRWWAAPPPGRVSLRPLLRFGLVLRANNFVTFGRDAVIPFAVGTVAGPAAAGYIRWAAAVANYPALLFLNVSRVFYPLFVRLKARTAVLRPAVEGALHASVWFSSLLSVPLFGLADPLVRLVFKERWWPAIPLFDVLVPINVLLAAIVTAGACFDARGRPGVRLGFAVAGGAVLWGGTLLALRPFGILGFGYANLAMNLVELGLVGALARSLPGLALPWRPALAAAVTGLTLRATVNALPAVAGGWPGVLALAAVGGAAFLLLAGPVRAPRPA